MRDRMLELWLRLLCLHIEETPDEDSLNRIIRDKWLLASRGLFNGCVPVDLDGQVSTEEGKKIVVDAIDSCLRGLSNADETLSGDLLDLLRIEGSFGDIETWRLIEIGEAFLDLIEGRIVGTAAKTEFMPGCKDKPNKRLDDTPKGVSA